jgi:hypothetical protein
VLVRKKLSILVVTGLMLTLLVAFPAFATHCVNDHKPQGAGTQAFPHNSGTAGFVDVSQFGGPKVDVFVHPSVSQSEEIGDPELGAPGQFNGAAQDGSLPEGAHDSEGWSEV